MTVDIFKKSEENLKPMKNLRFKKIDCSSSLKEAYLFTSKSSKIQKKQQINAEENYVPKQELPSVNLKQEAKVPTFNTYVEAKQIKKEVADNLSLPKEGFETKAVSLNVEENKKPKNSFLVTLLVTMLFSVNMLGLYFVYQTLKVKSDAISEIREDVEVIDSELFFLNETIKDGLIDKNDFIDELRNGTNNKKINDKKYLMITDKSIQNKDSNLVSKQKQSINLKPSAKRKKKHFLR